MDPSQSAEDAFLAYRCTREPAALAKVYDHASPRLLSVAMHLTKSPATAEDVVQDTFLIALENPDRWDETKPLLPWLLGILSNRVRQVDGLSRRAIDPARLLVPDSADPQEDSEATELLAQVDDAITHLPQPYRGVVLLRLRNGLSPADISIALGRNPNTVRTQLARGMEMLRKVLPTSVGILLAGKLSAGTVPSTSRQVVLQRATDILAKLTAQHRIGLIRRATLAVTGVVAACVLTWTLWPAIPTAALQWHSVEPTATPATDAAEAGMQPDTRTTATNTRNESVPLGAADITVLVRGSGLPVALVELEPLGQSPRLFVHNYAYPQRQWRAIESAKPLARVSWRSGFTAANGRCAFDDLEPGYWACRTLGITEVFKVEAGKAARVRIAAPDNTTVVQGLVLAADGRAIAGAPIWKVNRRVRSSSVIITHSDTQGRFTAAVPPLATLGAFHAGFAPIAITVSAREWSPQRNVVMQFLEPGASVSGQVLAADGKPRAGVVVEVGQVGDLGVAWANNEPQVLARVHRTTTDADGHYRFDSLVPGHTVLRARTESHGVAQHPIDLVAREHLQRNLQLPSECILTGQLTDASGEPAAGVIVRIGGRQAFGRCSTLTDAEGCYQLRGISPGRSTVIATDLDGRFAWHDLTLDAGDHVEWTTAVLHENLTIAGQVVDTRDQPIANAWLVHHRGQGHTIHQLGPDGHFSIPVNERDAGTPGSVQVFDRDPRDHRGALTGDIVAVLPQVRPSANLHKIRVPDRVANSSLRGRIVVAPGTPVAGTGTLLGTRERRAWRMHFDLQADGSFLVNGLPEGTYRIRLDRVQRRSFGPFQLASGQRLVLGDVRLAQEALTPPEHLRRFSLLFPDRTAGSDAVTIEVHDGSGWLVNRKMQAATSNGAPSIFMMLPAGTFEVRATSASGLVAKRTLVVAPDEPVRRAVMLEFEQP